MKSKIITLSELGKNNPRGCWLPLRYFGKCFRCDRFDNCDSVLESKKGIKYKKLVAERKELNSQAQKISDKINEL